MGHQPVFSVVIPTYNRPDRLVSCLKCMGRMDYPRDRFEVIVVDDGSQFSLEPVVAPFRECLQLTLLTQRNRGPAGARNRGAAHARGKYLVFLDDDCIPIPQWLAALAERFAAKSDVLIGGGIVNALPENPFSTATELIVSYVYDYFERDPKSFRFFNTSNLAVRTDQFRTLGGFSESFLLPAGEDYDFCHRWQYAGIGAVYAPEAVVLHAHHLTAADFWWQHFNYGRGLFICRLRIARRTGKRLRAHSGSFYLGLLRYPWTHEQGARWLYTGLVLMSQVATGLGALWEAVATMCKAEPSAPDRPAPR